MDEHPDITSAPVVLPVFEGESIVGLEGKLPAIAMDMEDGYARGTVLRLQVEVHVRHVRHEENKDGGLVRLHIFGLDSVELVAAFRPEQAHDDVGGSASARPAQTPGGQADIGLAFGRTGDLWAS